MEQGPGSSKQNDKSPGTTFGRRVYKGVKMFQNEIEEIQTMEIKDDDIFVCTFPRSGTTLIQELVYLIVTMDFEKACNTFLGIRFPFLDLVNNDLPYDQGIKAVEKLESPRMIKSHLHHFLLPEQLRNGKGRIIYSVRNPKDAIVSLCKLFHWLNELGDSSYDDFIEEFIAGTGFACPWTKHVLEYWSRRDDSNVLFLKYEEVSRDRPTAIRKIAKFLGRDITDDDIMKISDHCSIENMKQYFTTNLSHLGESIPMNEESSGRFINSGKLGGWRDWLTEEQSTRIDKMLDEVEREGLEILHT
ncbi:hypothetical protein ACF0H5_015732 [Mactra antiquata]